jgi:phosphoribosylaminoimidazole (AIR) synthetase
MSLKAIKIRKEYQRAKALQLDKGLRKILPVMKVVERLENKDHLEMTLVTTTGVVIIIVVEEAITKKVTRLIRGEMTIFLVVKVVTTN